ncbi:cytochrome P450 [Streptomyces sp. NPDC092952]|uniref:cytochrome P450 n=1 Tax=Streptomyces sp. NPDC092952 TaxID=3366018 RepID=UPI00381FABDE
MPTTDLPLFDDAILADPYPAYHALRTTGAAVHLSRYGVWAVSRHADVAAVLKDPTAFGSEDGIALTPLANEQVLAGTVLASDGARHTALRRVLSQQLAPRAMRGPGGRVAARADHLVAASLESGRFDAVALASDMVCGTVMELMGLPDTDRETLLAGAAATFDVFGPDNQRYQRALPLASRMVEMLHENLTRENVERGTWMGAVFKAVDAGQIAESDAIPLASAYVAASIDTTVLGLASCIVQLARNPAQWEILRRDPIRWSLPAFHEALRLEAPIQGLGRLLNQPADIGGVRLAEGEQVWLLYGSAGRDERRWGYDAHHYSIRRPRPEQHLAFGAGPHLCAGIALAELQARSVLRALAARCTRLHLDSSPVPILHNLLRGYRSAPVTARLAPGPQPRPVRQEGTS